MIARYFCKVTVLSLALTAMLVLAGCSDDSEKVSGGATDTGNALSDIRVDGVAQKGPFVEGSFIEVSELSGSSLVQTGRIIKGKVKENGAFSIDNISLVSNYALLVGNGFYVNEVTGEKSESQITLSAVVDLEKRNSVNVNFLTHLEYDRVAHLVKNEKVNFADAKRQAEAEIVKTLFGVNDTLSFEDLDIFGNTEGDAMLLAISVLVLGGRGDADMSELMAKFSTDIAADGSFDNEKIRAEIADYASVFLDMAKVREHVESLSGNSAPDFEKYVYAYWTNEYGLGDCKKDNDGELKKNANEYSGYRTANYICEDGAWKAYLFNPEYKYGSFTDPRNGYTYRTTEIAGKTWFAENLRYVNGQDERREGRYCFNNLEYLCGRFGFWLPYPEVSCPEGWRLPTREDWKDLFELAGGRYGAPAKLRARGAWNVNEHPKLIDDTDEFGFSALPAGVNIFGDIGNVAFFFASNLVKDSLGNEIERVYDAYVNVIEADESSLALTTEISVRCVKD